MRDRTIIPTNLLEWPRVENLLPDQKLILMSMWASRFANCIGCFELPVKMFAVSVSIQEAAIRDALAELVRRELIALDHSTSEVYISDWLRFHTFSGGKGESIYWATVAKIQSDNLRTIVLEKSAIFGLICPQKETVVKKQMVAAQQQQQQQHQLQLQLQQQPVATNTTGVHLDPQACKMGQDLIDAVRRKVRGAP